MYMYLTGAYIFCQIKLIVRYFKMKFYVLSLQYACVPLEFILTCCRPAYQFPTAFSWSHKRCFTFGCRLPSVLSRVSSVFLTYSRRAPPVQQQQQRQHAHLRRQDRASAELERTWNDAMSSHRVWWRWCFGRNRYLRLLWRRVRNLNTTMKLLFVVTLFLREALCGSPSVQIGRNLISVIVTIILIFTSLVHLAVLIILPCWLFSCSHSSLPVSSSSWCGPVLSLSSLFRSS